MVLLLKPIKWQGCFWLTILLCWGLIDLLTIRASSGAPGPPWRGCWRRRSWSGPARPRSNPICACSKCRRWLRRDRRTLREFLGAEPSVLRSGPSTRADLPWSSRAGRRGPKPSCRFQGWWGRSEGIRTSCGAGSPCQIPPWRLRRRPWCHGPIGQRCREHRHLEDKWRYCISQVVSVKILSE